MLTDRDERALLTAGENRISEPLRIRAALAAVRRALTGSGARSRTGLGSAPAQERESMPCHPTPRPTPRPAPVRR